MMLLRFLHEMGVEANAKLIEFDNRKHVLGRSDSANNTVVWKRDEQESPTCVTTGVPGAIPPPLPKVFLARRRPCSPAPAAPRMAACPPVDPCRHPDPWRVGHDRNSSLVCCLRNRRQHANPSRPYCRACRGVCQISLRRRHPFANRLRFRSAPWSVAGLHDRGRRPYTDHTPDVYRISISLRMVRSPQFEVDRATQNDRDGRQSSPRD